MLRFSANLSMLFTEYDFLERFDKAALSGFRGVEFMFPYDNDIEVLKRKLRDNNLEHTLHNLPAGDWAAGERGIACIPGREEEFRNGVAAAIRYARALGNKKINCLVGKTPSGFSATEIHDTLVENLRYAANMLAKEDILLLIEPINHFDMPGFHLTGTQQALALIKDIGSDNIKIQYDIYHMQRMEGELTQTMTAWADKIGHLQIADNPRRGEPGTGEINYDFIFNVIKQSGYDGWVGCEYKPLTTTEAGLSWINQYR
ncbi:hydroxypyruvate isomerase [Salmonella enterica]|uniref:Hydroxypyruvate isomerase n=1 Tax=Salmonella enterica TaxID=28901 RepID=A0A763MB63_SALER|nr:hydroxypyruvate isomerase [Salmonella enterica subsp. enterica serovar Kapemba]EAX4767391.1 hydroxypyruvate isomerase [Salmonella enterica]ECE8258046.1 hydroxypyruvate isomerase [Salmonella enterica subsp. enterica serovar Hvittingfoss]ECI3618374.1 hydroxypyruvate isomerase [Salmonella enterica subsp. enterica]EDW5001860.1 hydroxypyruvate isomerase [Salmonella enterica subsp. enterica serovar Isangi]EHT2134257.1 hydroxypyruvate isomerase [Salmonella enterica subsp. enterica serovar Enteriti